MSLELLSHVYENIAVTYDKKLFDRRCSQPGGWGQNNLLPCGMKEFNAGTTQTCYTLPEVVL